MTGKLAQSVTPVATVIMVAELSASEERTVKKLASPTKPMAALLALPVDIRSLEVRRLAQNVTQADSRLRPTKSRAMPAYHASSQATTVQREHRTPLIFRVKKVRTQTKVKRSVAKFARKVSTSQWRDKSAAKDAQQECF